MIVRKSISLSFDFFFSSRRRHTRCSRDWSSDVCSSDLDAALVETRDAALRLDWKAAASSLVEAGKKLNEVPKPNPSANNPEPLLSLARSTERSEERRVGKECRSQWGRDSTKEQTAKELS